MAEIVVVGGTKQQRALVEQAAAFYSTFLIGDTGSLFLTIKLKRALLNKECVKADCLLDEDEDDYKSFEIRIDSLMNMPGILRSLAHEMVHVSQYYSGKMKDRGVSHVIWKGQTMSVTIGHYYDLPWEVEAYGAETGLFERFVTRKKLGKAKWYKDRDYL
jgi:RNA-binding protein YhbY